MREYPEVDILIRNTALNQFSTDQARSVIQRKKRVYAPTNKRLGQILKADPRIKREKGRWSIVK